MGHHPAEKYRATRLPEKRSLSSFSSDEEPSSATSGDKDKMAAASAAAINEEVEDTKRRDGTCRVGCPIRAFVVVWRHLVATNVVITEDNRREATIFIFLSETQIVVAICAAVFFVCDGATPNGTAMHT